MRHKAVQVFLMLLVLAEIGHGLEDNQKSSLEETNGNSEKSSVADLLLTDSNGRKRKGRRVVRRRHALRNRGDYDQAPDEYFQQNYSPRQSFSDQNYQQNYSPRQQPTQNQNHQQPAQNTYQPPFNIPIPFQNPTNPQQPQINNYYYQPPNNQPFFPPYYNPYQQQPQPPPYPPIIVIQVPYCPQSSAPDKTHTTGVRINIPDDDNNPIPQFNYQVYNTSKTGISLDPIPPLYKPSIVPPPLFREEPEESNYGAQSINPRPQPQPQPQTTTNRLPLRNRKTTTTTTTESPYIEDDEYDNSCGAAIVKCCTPNMNVKCFESSNCPFVFDDPCQDLREAAESIAMKKTMGRK